MRKEIFAVIVLVTLSFGAIAQDQSRDTLPRPVTDEIAVDTSLDYDDLFDDLSAFLDSLMRPRSYFMASISAYSGYFNFTERNNTRLSVQKKMMYSPFAGYFHKSGLGISLYGNLVDDDKHLNLYQYAISPSIDFLRNRKLIGGLSYTHYFTKDSLPFYTTPIKDEVNGYITWRKPWLQSSLSVNYGWGNLRDYKDRLSFIERFWLRRRVVNFLGLNGDAGISELSVTAAVLHNFYWLKIFSQGDNIRLTPQLLFTCGTQQFGLNQPAVSNTNTKTPRTNALNVARELMLDDKNEFKPVSLSTLLKAEYSIRKFFIQPQLTFDYYFPADRDNLSVLFSMSMGFSF